ncbi:glycosyltransferase [Salibacterium sp. K-3]
MRIHLWSASYGFGHNRAARVLQQEWRKRGHTAEIFHPFETGARFVFPGSKNVYKLLMNYAPSLWRYCCRQKVPPEGALLLARWFEKTVQPAVEADAVLSVHPLMTAVAAAAKTKRPDLLLYHAATDYWLAPAADLPEVDGMFLPAGAAVTESIPPVFPFGIPVESKNRPYSKKQCCLENGWKSDKPLILMNGGGEGPFPAQKILRAIRHLQPPSTIVLITAGQKKRHHLTLEGHDVILHPLTDRFIDYLQACDVLITKAGGMTLTEAMLYETPVVVAAPLPGQEEFNAEYAARHHAALKAESPENVWEMASMLLHSPFKRERMKRRQKRLQQPDSAGRIVDMVLQSLSTSDVSGPYILPAPEQQQAEPDRAAFRPMTDSGGTKE